MASNPPLFDAFERTDTSPQRNSEPSFLFLNRCAWSATERVRDLLEAWFSHYPIEHAAHLRGRFRSTLDEQHEGAFFELLVYQLLLRLGCSVVVGSPDFLACLPSGEMFYIETTLAGSGTLEYTPIERGVLDELNQLNCPEFWLQAEFEGHPSATPPLRQMRAEFQSWINELTSDVVQTFYNTNGEYPSHMYTRGPWTLRLRVIPRGEKGRATTETRPLGIYPLLGWSVNSWQLITKAVTDKGNQHRGLDQPLIVAINAMGAVGIDQESVIEGLFGQEQITVGLDSQDRPISVTPSRAPNGAWTARSSPRYTRVSSVLLFRSIHPFNLASASVCLYENPWTSYPAPKALRRFPHVLVEEGSLRQFDGEMLRELLGLQADWPGPR